jgi:cytochrome bd-type quinol oxidase subunit 2
MAEHTTAGGTHAEAETEKDAAAPAGRRLGQGPGRLLLWFYGVFTVAALSRSLVQISTKFHEAPLAYVLSLAAGVVYAVITVALWRGGDQARRVALVSCSAELAGVVAVGVLTVADSSAFPDQTVWSDFGAGYVFLPLLLPVMGLLWLRRSAREAREASTAA